MAIANILTNKSSSGLVESIAALDRQVVETEGRRPALLAALDNAVLSGTGESEAESALLALDTELARLAVRRGAFARGHADALKREAAEALQRALRAVRTAISKHDEAAKLYDTSAALTVRKANALHDAAAEVVAANALVERLGGEPIACDVADTLIRDLHVPHSSWGEQAHHEKAASANPLAHAVREHVAAATAAGERKLDEYASGVQSVVSDMIDRFKAAK